MATLLKWVGGIWAAMGFGNLVMMPWAQGIGQGLLSVGLIFNVVLFVIPGLIVYGIGAAITKKQASGVDTQVSSNVAMLQKSTESRLQELGNLRDKGLISSQEFENRKNGILQEV